MYAPIYVKRGQGRGWNDERKMTGKGWGKDRAVKGQTRRKKGYEGNRHGVARHGRGVNMEAKRQSRERRV